MTAAGRVRDPAPPMNAEQRKGQTVAIMLTNTCELFLYEIIGGLAHHVFINCYRDVRALHDVEMVRRWLDKSESERADLVAKVPGIAFHWGQAMALERMLFVPFRDLVEHVARHPGARGY